MKSVKLTFGLRQRIIHIATLGVLDKEIADARAKFLEAGMVAYNSAFTEEERGMMKKLGKRFFAVKTEIYFCSEHNSRNYVRVRFYDALPVTHSVMQGLSLSVGDEVLKALKDTQQALDELTQSKAEIVKKVADVVASVNTTKRLLEVWPEAEAYLPKDIEATENLPALANMSDLNELLAKHRVVPQSTAVSGDEFSNGVAQAITAEVQQVAA